MKLIFTFLVFAFSATLFSQSIANRKVDTSADLVEIESIMSDGTQSALEARLPINSKDSEKIWKSFVKELGKVDWDRKNKEHVLFNVVIRDIDRYTPVTIIAKFDKAGDETNSLFWIKKEGDYLSSGNDPEAFAGGVKFVHQYFYETQRHAVLEQISQEEDDLNQLSKELDKLKKKNSNLHDDIRKYREDIAKAEADIDKNINEQEAQVGKIEGQQKAINTTKEQLAKIGKS